MCRRTICESSLIKEWQVNYVASCFPKISLANRCCYWQRSSRIAMAVNRSLSGVLTCDVLRRSKRICLSFNLRFNCQQHVICSETGVISALLLALETLRFHFMVSELEACIVWKKWWEIWGEEKTQDRVTLQDLFFFSPYRHLQRADKIIIPSAFFLFYLDFHPDKFN